MSLLLYLSLIQGDVEPFKTLTGVQFAEEICRIALPLHWGSKLSSCHTPLSQFKSLASDSSSFIFLFFLLSKKLYIFLFGRNKQAIPHTHK